MVMLITLPILMCLTTFFFPIHGLGLFALSLITHGLLVTIFGEAAARIPLLGGFLVAITLLLKGHFEIKVSRSLVALFCLFLIMTVSALMGINKQQSILVLLLYTKAFLICILAFFVVKDEREIKVLALYLLVGVFIGSFIALYQYATGTYTINFSYLQRASSLSKDPNDTAMLLSCGIPLAAFWALHGNKPSVRILNVVVLACTLAAIILTKSRGGFVTLIVVMGILYIMNVSLKTTFVAVIALFGIFIFGASTGYWDRVETLATFEESGNSLRGRLDSLEKGGILFLENVVIGVGPGNFEETYQKLHAEEKIIEPAFSRRGAVAHNLYVDFAVENGAFGITLLLFVFYIALHNFVFFPPGDPVDTHTGITPYLAISLIALLTSGLFLSQGKSTVLWFLVGLGFAAGQVKRSSVTGTANQKRAISEKQNNLTQKG